MKLPVNSLLFVIAAGIGLAVGFALGGNLAPGSTESPVATSTSHAESPGQRLGAQVQGSDLRRHDDLPLATRLEHDLSGASGASRWLYWLEALEKAAPADFPRFARLAQGDATAFRLVVTRWIELDPRHLFETIVGAVKTGGGFPTRELAELLFQEWAVRDPEAVIAALNGPDGSVLCNWRRQVASTIIERDAERGLRLMCEWHIENYGPRMIAVAKWAAADPRRAAEFTLENPAGAASRRAMETIGIEWAKTDPVRALEFAARQPGELSSQLANATLKEWAGRNLIEAADWLAGADAGMRNRLSPTFVEAWAKQDSAGALAWCEENLSGSSLAQAVGGALKSVAEKDVAGAAALVAGMSPSSARTEAAVAVAQKWFPEYYSGKAVGTETITWLASLDADSVKRVLERVGWHWINSDPKSMAAFLASPESDQVPVLYYSDLARNMARNSPLEALEWSSRLTEDRGLEAGGGAFYTWWRGQPEAAMKWLGDLPSTDSRRQPFLESVTRIMALDPQGAEQLAQIRAADRAAARSIIERMTLSEDRRSRLLEVLKQP